MKDGKTPRKAKKALKKKGMVQGQLMGKKTWLPASSRIAEMLGIRKK